MKRRGRNERLKTAYKKAFEESFVDNFDGWGMALCDVNTSIVAIGKLHRKKCKLYSYDEFCCLAKLTIDERLDSVDWDKMICHEEFRIRSSRTKIKHDRQTTAKASRHIAVMETEILFMCFEKAMLNSIGPALYKKYKSEIEQFKEEEIIM